MRTSFALLVCVVGVSGYAQTPGTFTATGQMTTARANHTATLLFDGRVLIAGGYNSSNGTEQLRMATAEIYDPVARTFMPVGNMTTGRSGHTATLLPDGRVLITGGDPGAPSGSAELYDPSTQSFNATGSMVNGRMNSKATLLSNGKVLISGGIVRYDVNPVIVGDAEVYDPSTGTFAPTGGYAGSLSSMLSAEWFDSTSTMLADGTVLMATEPAAEIYDPVTDRFSLRGSMLTGGALPYLGGRTASLLMNGRVLVAGGDQEELGRFNNAELYDPATGAFNATGAMTVARDHHTATPLPDGTILMAGGQSDTCSAGSCYGVWGSEASAELYDPAQGVFTAAGSMTQRRDSHAATLLNNGDVLLTGGNYWGGAPWNPIITMFYGSLATAELYHPASPVPAPLLFSLAGDGKGQGAIWHAATGQVASADNPAVAGEALSMYTTSLVDGGVIPPQVAIGGRLAEILFFGKAPGYPGFNQANFRVPSGVASGSAVPVRLTYLSRPSNQVTIGVQ